MSHSHKNHHSKSRRYEIDEDRTRSRPGTSRTVLYDPSSSSSTTQRTLSSTIRQVIPSSSSSSFYNTSTTENRTSTKSLTIRHGKHSRAINSDIYSSEIVEDEDEEEEHHHDEENDRSSEEKDEEILDEILYSNDQKKKRRRNSSSHSDSSKHRKRDQRRSPSEEGEEKESPRSERSDEEEKRSPQDEIEEETRVAEPGRSRFDDEEEEKNRNDDEGRNSSGDDDDDDDDQKRSRRRSSSTPHSSIDSKSEFPSPRSNPIEEKPSFPVYYPAIQGCRRVDEYKCLNRIEEGAYGVVFRAKDIKTGEIVALKRLKMEKEKEGFPITSLREICCILKSQHENVCTVREIVVGEDMNRIFIVMDYVEHDLKTLMTHVMKKPFSIGEVKTLLYQLLSGVNHLHDNWIIHRDLKTSNLLLSNKGILKIGDFGLAREYGSPLKPYTPIVVTLWYRAPELLLGVKEYSCPIDIWSVGAIFGELLLMKPLFPGKSELDQLNRIFKDLGTPNEKIWPEYNSLPFTKKMNFSTYPYNRLRSRFDATLSEKGFDLLNKFFTYDPSKRISAGNALKHPYFDEIPRRIDPSMFPTWPSRNEEKEKTTLSLQRLPGSNSGTMQNEPKAPSAGKMYEKLLGDDDSDSIERNLPPPSGFQLRG